MARLGRILIAPGRRRKIIARRAHLRYLHPCPFRATEASYQHQVIGHPARRLPVRRAGTTLQVIGRFNRWLKIDRNGQTVWMADWVNYTRVDGDGQEQISLQETLDPSSYQVVDNCCFVDRQCHTDHEWTQWLLGFSNGQCSAPAHSTVSGLNIEGTEACVMQIEKALALMRSRATRWFAYAQPGFGVNQRGAGMERRGRVGGRKEI